MASAVKTKQPEDHAVLRGIVSDLQKKLGTGANVSIMGDNLFAAEPDLFIPSSSTLLNRAIGGGAALGRIMEILGDVQTGKTLLAMDFLASMQRMGGLAFYLDTEFGTSKAFAKQLCHIDDSNLGHIEVKYQEMLWKAVQVTVAAARKDDQDAPLCIVGDSVAALSARATRELDFDEQAQMALEARIIRSALRRLNSELATERATLILTNHEIFKIGAPAFSEKTESWGGRAIRYFASTRLKTITVGNDKKDGEIQAVNCRVKVIKNRFDPPGRIVEYPINVRGEHVGIDDRASLVNFLWTQGALGTNKGFAEFEGLKLRKAELIEQAWKDTKLYEAIKAKALEVYDTRAEFEEEI